MDRRVNALLEAWALLTARVSALEGKVEFLKGQVKATLAAEAEERELQDQEEEKARWEADHDL